MQLFKSNDNLIVNRSDRKRLETTLIHCERIKDIQRYFSSGCITSLSKPHHRYTMRSGGIGARERG